MVRWRRVGTDHGIDAEAPRRREAHTIQHTLEAQPYDRTPIGSPHCILDFRSSFTSTSASVGSCCHAGTTPLRSGMTCPKASFSSQWASTTVVKGKRDSSSAPPFSLRDVHGGQVLFAGTPEALVADENVRRLYLGESFTL